MTEPFQYTYLHGCERVTLLQRYKRFLADVRRADGSVITVHVPNSGAMTTCWEPGDQAVISDSGNDKRKLRHTLEVVNRNSHWVGVNTAIPNRAAAHFIRANAVAELAGYPELATEVKYGDGLRSRIDILLSQSPARGGTREAGQILPGDCFVEVKNTTLIDGIHGAFPDAKSERAAKHCEELAHVLKQARSANRNANHGLANSTTVRAVMLFFMGRADELRFRPADEVDPAYGKALRKAVKAGVEPLAIRFEYRVTDEPLGTCGLELRALGSAPVDL
jgi:sugar fermentation stimulation protein A